MAGCLRNFRRAGTLKNSDATSTVVPRARAAGSATLTRPPSMRTRCPSPAASAVTTSTRATAAIDASASPRKPSVPTRWRSSKLAILLVAWRSKASRASSRPIPEPSSATTIRRFPPASSSTRTSEAPASRAFSTSSFTTDAGRSTTSPAAIWLTRWSERRWMRGMDLRCGLQVFPNDARMASSDAQQRESGTVGMPPPLLPVAKRMDADPQCSREPGLREPDKPPQGSDVVA